MSGYDLALAVFKEQDKENTLTMPAANFKQIFAELDQSITAADVSELITKAGMDASGDLNYQEMLSFIFEKAPSTDVGPPPSLVREKSVPMPELPLIREITGHRHASVTGDELAKSDDVPQPLSLLRGFTGTVREDEALSALVLAAMSKLGWEEAVLANIKVKDCSGYGGSKTYKVTCEGCKPESVALHSRSEATAKASLSEARMEAAAALFSNVGLAPPRLVYGGDWFIEPWEGTGAPAFKDIEKCAEFGRLLAQVHQIPSDWFDSWREKLCVEFPPLRGVPLGSHVWWFSARYGEWLQPMSEEHRNAFLKADFFDPVSPAAQRIVTTHGDLHPGNMIQTESGIKCIDFEFADVTYAAYDLGYTFMWLGSEAGEKKRAFLKAYLLASGFATEGPEADEAYLDAEIQWYCFHMGSFAPWRRNDWFPLIDFWKLAIREARSDPDIRAQVLGGKAFRDVFEGHPKIRALKLPFDKAIKTEKFSKLPVMPNTVPRETPLFEYTAGGDVKKVCDINGQMDQMTITFWMVLHDFQLFPSKDHSTVLSSNLSNEDEFAIQIKREMLLRYKFLLPAPGEASKDGDAIIKFPTDGRWHQCALVYDALKGVLTYYIDGLGAAYYFELAFPIRLTLLSIGADGFLTVPMDSYRNIEEAKKLLVITVSGHPDDSYNGSYTQQNGLFNNKPWFKNAGGRFLKKYDAGGGGGADWSFDHRQPEECSDWCEGGYYDAEPGIDLRIGTFMWKNPDMLLTISWGEKGIEDDSPVKSLTLKDARHAFESEFFEGQLTKVLLFNKCLQETEIQKLYDEQKIYDFPPPAAPAAPTLEKIKLDGLLTWKGHEQRAVDLGGSLPTRTDLILASVGTDEKDVWLPVSRSDAAENDWVQIARAGHHPRYCSHKDRYGSPGWSTNTEPSGLNEGWRVLYFYIKKL